MNSQGSSEPDRHSAMVVWREISCDSRARRCRGLAPFEFYASKREQPPRSSFPRTFHLNKTRRPSTSLPNGLTAFEFSSVRFSLSSIFFSLSLFKSLKPQTGTVDLHQEPSPRHHSTRTQQPETISSESSLPFRTSTLLLTPFKDRSASSHIVTSSPRPQPFQEPTTTSVSHTTKTYPSCLNVPQPRRLPSLLENFTSAQRLVRLLSVASQSCPSSCRCRSGRKRRFLMATSTLTTIYFGPWVGLDRLHFNP